LKTDDQTADGRSWQKPSAFLTFRVYKFRVNRRIPILCTGSAVSIVFTKQNITDEIVDTFRRIISICFVVVLN